MPYFRSLEHFVVFAAHTVPLPWFVFFGSFLEEVISPIPSALIMGTAGSLALVQHRTFWYLLWLAVFGNIGKTLGAWIYYAIGDKLEDLLVKPINRFLGIRHQDIENIGKRFTGHHWKDGGILFLLRFIPIVPTTPVSLAAGIIKMDLKVFLVATYLGNIFKDIFYIYAGYVGLANLRFLWHRIDFIKYRVDFIVAAGLLVFFFVLYRHQRGK